MGKKITDFSSFQGFKIKFKFFLLKSEKSKDVAL